jgi:hypothetical protein
MNRRRFLQVAVAGASAVHDLNALCETPARVESTKGLPIGLLPAGEIGVEGHTFLCSFNRRGEEWKVYEDLRVRDGMITLVSGTGKARILPKTAEATFAENGPKYLGPDLKDIGMSAHDLLADRLLLHGDPDEDEVRGAAPPMDSAQRTGRGYRPSWNTIVGTRECSDTMPVYPSGNTRTYHPVQYFKELTQERAAKRYEGLVGGWMPAVHKVMPGDSD